MMKRIHAIYKLPFSSSQGEQIMNVKCIKSNKNGTFVFILTNIMLLSVRLVSELKETFKLHLNLRFDDIDNGDVRCLTLNACDSGHLMSSLLNTQQYIFVAVTTPWNTLQHIDCVIPLHFRCVHSFRQNVDTTIHVADALSSRAVHSSSRRVTPKT